VTYKLTKVSSKQVLAIAPCLFTEFYFSDAGNFCHETAEANRPNQFIAFLTRLLFVAGD
jgi:hypothetical protein